MDSQALAQGFFFGQSIVDFTADPWTGVQSKRDSKAAGAQKKTKKKESRLERESFRREKVSLKHQVVSLLRRQCGSPHR